MRIRKRKVPFPISSLSPIPISDPLFAGPPVQLHLLDDADDYYDPRPSDQPAPDGPEGENKEDVVLWEESGGGHDQGNLAGEKIIINNNSTRKGSPSNVGALVEKNMILQQPAVLSSLEEKVAEACKAEVKTMGGSEKMKRKVSGRKNTERHNGYAKEENDQSSGGSIRSADLELDAVAGGAATFNASGYNIGNDVASGKKGRGRSGGAVLMEGSRCSRVNGRGWRCCQQTLVGYSLCEHHLGKGRLRNMNNVRSSQANEDNVAQKKNKAVTQMPLSNYGQEIPKKSSRSGDEHGGLGKTVTAVASMSRRRRKLGVVKARSMSSLLGQKNEASDHDQL